MTETPLANQLLKLSKSELARILLKLPDSNSALLKIQPRLFKHSNTKKEAKPIPVQPVLLKIQYLGLELSGLQKSGDTPFTVQEVLQHALYDSNMVNSINCPMLLCGRTDAGVSAHGNVVQLWLRAGGDTGATLDSLDTFKEYKPLDYCAAVNPRLPKEIQIREYALVPPGFNCRFDCRWRSYSYLILNGKRCLNVEKMNGAAQLLKGQHDFRNFCREEKDNYVRQILEISLSEHCNDLVLNIKGTGFLYHMVRCITAILVLIGGGYEDASVIANLLDAGRFEHRPLYEMAPAEFLVFQDAGYEKPEDYNCQIKSNLSRQLKQLSIEAIILQLPN